MALLNQWLDLTQSWKGAFAQGRTHQRAQSLALGLLAGMGTRTITRALGFLGKEQQDWSADYKLFNRSPWEPVRLFDPLFKAAVDDYHADSEDPIPVALDDTVVSRCGKQVPNTSWQRDPMSPPFHVNLIWGQRYLQASLLLPLYREDSTSSPRALPIRFAECPVIRKPRKRAGDQEWADYKKARKQHNLSTHFVSVVKETRHRLDDQGRCSRQLLALGDGSFCNRTTFGSTVERTHLLCRARKDLRLCFRHSGAGPRYYDTHSFTPQSVYENKRRRWKIALIFHGGNWRRVRYKEVKKVLWRTGAKRKELRLLVLAPTPYLKTTTGRKYYRQKAFLLTDDLETPVRVLLQDYFDRFQIEFNHRDEKSILGVGQAQVWAKASTPRVPEFIVASYSAMLLASLKTYGPKRTHDYLILPKWRRGAKRPSCLDMVTLLRKEINQHARDHPEGWLRGFEQMISRAAA